jgi:glycosyltransferase involved in cell wall biosynthesis
MRILSKADVQVIEYLRTLVCTAYIDMLDADEQYYEDELLVLLPGIVEDWITDYALLQWYENVLDNVMEMAADGYDQPAWEYANERNAGWLAFVEEYCGDRDAEE